VITFAEADGGGDAPDGVAAGGGKAPAAAAPAAPPPPLPQPSPLASPSPRPPRMASVSELHAPSSASPAASAAERLEPAVISALVGQLGAWVPSAKLKSAIAAALGITTRAATELISELVRRCAAGHRLPGGFRFEVRGATSGQEFRLQCGAGAGGGGSGDEGGSSSRSRSRSSDEGAGCSPSVRREAGGGAANASGAAPSPLGTTAAARAAARAEAAVLKALRGQLGAWVATAKVRNIVAPALGLSKDSASREMKALTRRCAVGHRLQPGGLLFEIRGADYHLKEYRLSAPGGGEEAGGGGDEAGGGGGDEAGSGGEEAGGGGDEAGGAGGSDGPAPESARSSSPSSRHEPDAEASETAVGARVEAAVVSYLRDSAGAWLPSARVRDAIALSVEIHIDVASRQLKALSERCAAGHRLPEGFALLARGAGGSGDDEGGGSGDDEGGGQQAGRSATPMAAGAEGGGALAPVQAAVVSMLASKPGVWTPSAEVREAVCRATGLTPGYALVRLRDVALLPLPGGWRLEAGDHSQSHGKAYRLVAAAADGASPPAPTIDGSLKPRLRVEAAAVAFLKV
jgi:hypothetical protein